MAEVWSRFTLPVSQVLGQATCQYRRSKNVGNRLTVEVGMHGR